MPWPLTFLSSQLFFTPPLPITSLSSQVYLVTGANTGLGLAACAHLARCNAALIVLAVRSSSSGEAAIASLISTTGRPASAFKLEILDLASYESVVKFGERVRKYERLDAVIQNAGILPQKWEEAEGMERTVVVNDISAVLLGMLLLPALRNSAQKTGKMGRLVFVGSDVMMVAKFGENKGRGASGLSILEVLSDEKRAGMGDRYPTSKLLLAMAVRALAEQSPLTPDSNVLITYMSPGACKTDLIRGDRGFFTKLVLRIVTMIISRTTEVGGRTLVNAAAPRAEAHGAFIWDVVKGPGPFIESKEGKALQEEWREELWAKLESIKPGVTRL